MSLSYSRTQPPTHRHSLNDVLPRQADVVDATAAPEHLCRDDQVCDNSNHTTKLGHCPTNLVVVAVEVCHPPDRFHLSCLMTRPIISSASPSPYFSALSKKFCAKSHGMNGTAEGCTTVHTASAARESYHTRVECCFHDSRRCLQAAVTPTGTLKQSRSHQDGNDLIGMTEVAVAAHLVAKLSPKCNPRAVAEYRYSVATAKNRKHHRTPKAFYFGWRECDEAFVFVCCFAYLRPVLPSRRYCMAGSSSQVLPPGAT